VGKSGSGDDVSVFVCVLNLIKLSITFCRGLCSFYYETQKREPPFLSPLSSLPRLLIKITDKERGTLSEKEWGVVCTIFC
jgi:hypothetical protein